MAGRIPPSRMPPRGMVARNSQLTALIPRTTMETTTRRMGTTTTRAMSASSAKPSRWVVARFIAGPRACGAGRWPGRP